LVTAGLSVESITLTSPFSALLIHAAPPS
jgi:hypothetical protein